jgi:hypothetical protein
MRTTIRLSDALIRQAKTEAARRGETVTALIEQGLRLVLAGSRRRPRKTPIALPVSHATGGTRPGVDLNDSSAVLDLLDGRS